MALSRALLELKVIHNPPALVLRQLGHKLFIVRARLHLLLNHHAGEFVVEAVHNIAVLAVQLELVEDGDTGVVDGDAG